MAETSDRPAPEHELDASPWLRVESTIMATARLMREAYDAVLAPLDLHLTEASLLAFVVEKGALTQTALADQLRIGRAAAGKIVDHLQERGLVERTADASDRRVWLVAPTPAGAELATRIGEIDLALRSELRRDITRAERQTLAGILVRLQENLVRAQRPARSTDEPTAAT